MMAKKYLVTDDELRAKVLAILRDVDTNPIGTVISFMGQQPPALYLRCDGGQYVVAEYQELCNFFAANFGAVNYFGGDGEQYFAVPNLSGEFLRGTGTNGHTWTDMYGNVGREGAGSDVGVHQPATQHTAIWASDSRFIVADELKGTLPNSDAVTYISAKPTRVSSSSKVNNSMSAFITSRPTNTSVLFCIKAKNG